jgi:hypothetical protein
MATAIRPLVGALALGIATIALAGCGLLGYGKPPDWVEQRTPLPLCGEETAGQVDSAARRCLLEAFQSGGEGELISTMTTVEGDPITRYVRVYADGVVEIFHDATRDRYGSGRWERLRCRALVPVEETNTPDSYMPPEYVFTEQDCESVP